MGQKIHPVAIRLGINRTFDASWYHDDFYECFKTEYVIRKALNCFFGFFNVTLGRIFYQKSHQKTIVTFLIRHNKTIKARSQSKPLLQQLENALSVHLQQNILLKPISYCLPSALFLAEQIAFNIVKNKKSYKRSILSVVSRLQANKSAIKGVRVLCSGRLGGVEMARRFSFKKGQTSLNVFSQKIDFARAKALTKYGMIGVKVWLSYK